MKKILTEEDLKEVTGGKDIPCNVPDMGSCHEEFMMEMDNKKLEATENLENLENKTQELKPEELEKVTGGDWNYVDCE